MALITSNDGVNDPNSAAVLDVDKTNFISQKDHKATYIAVKESRTLQCDTLTELQQYASHKKTICKI